MIQNLTDARALSVNIYIYAQFNLLVICCNKIQLDELKPTAVVFHIKFRVKHEPMCAL